MTPNQRTLLMMADEKLASARDNLKQNRWRSAVSDAYYAMYDAARSALIEKGVESTSHGECIGQFGKEFAKTGILPKELHRQLIDAFEARSDSDYLPEVEPSEVSVRRHVAEAENFVTVIQRFLARALPT